MLFSAPTDAGSLYISSCSFLTFALQKMGCNQLLKLARKCSFVWYLLIEIVVFFSFTGSSIPFLGRRRQSLTDCHFRIWTQRVTFETLDPSDIWSEWCQYKKTKRQKDKKTKGQKDQRTKRQKDKKAKIQKRVWYFDIRAVSHYCDVFWMKLKTLFPVHLPLVVWSVISFSPPNSEWFYATTFMQCTCVHNKLQLMPRSGHKGPSTFATKFSVFFSVREALMDRNRCFLTHLGKGWSNVCNWHSVNETAVYTMIKATIWCSPIGAALLFKQMNWAVLHQLAQWLHCTKWNVINKTNHTLKHDIN